MKPLAYERPTTVEEAIAALGQGDARALAGGTDLIVQIREGRKSVGRAVDLKRIPELTAIAQQPDGGFRIGAAANFNKIAAHAALAAAYPAVPNSGRLVGSLQVQNRAGLGGNICNASPSADAVPVVICLDARAEIAGPKGRRHGGGRGHYSRVPGARTLAADEMLVSILLPPARPGARAATCASRRAARWTLPSPAQAHGSPWVRTARLPKRASCWRPWRRCRCARQSAEKALMGETAVAVRCSRRRAAGRARGTADRRYARVGRVPPRARSRADDARAGPVRTRPERRRMRP